MYEEGNKKNHSNWLSLAIKLALLVLFVFILVWVFSKNGNNTKPNVISENSSSYVNNIVTMKTAALEYFTDSKLPTKVGETEKLTLSQMVNQKLIIDFTKDGKSCDLTNSYVQATKTADENYALKVSLNCEKKSDFIVTTIAKKCAVVGNTCKEEAKNETITDKTPNNTGNSNLSNNSSSNGEYKPEPSKSNNVSTPVKTTIKITVTCPSCNTSFPTPNPTPSKTLYYKYVKYDQWYEGYRSGSEYENKCSDATYYDYCKERTNTYYTTSHIHTNRENNTQYSYTLKLDNISNYRTKENTVRLSSKSYFTSSINDYRTYINSRNNCTTIIGENQNCNVYPSSVYDFKNSSLKNDNFNFNVSEIYKNGNGYYVDITIYYKNKYGVNPYYAKNLGQNLYYVPLKFNVNYSTNSDCLRDTEANQWKYSGYKKSNPTYESDCRHRKISYRWSSLTSLDGYSYTGISEYR